MAKYSGRIRVFLILTILIKITVADLDPLSDPSLEIIKQEDAEEGDRPRFDDPNGIPCRDPTPTNGVLEVVSGVPFQINNITVRLKCLHGLVFSDGSMEKIEHCYAAPTPIKVTGIWYPDQGRLVCKEPHNKIERKPIESLLCKDPKSPNNIVKVLKGTPNHLYSAIEVSCPNGRHFKNGQEAVNVTCLPLPDPCYCKASWETLDKYLLVDDFNCTAPNPSAQVSPRHSPMEPMHTPGPNPVPCRDPTPVDGALEVISGVPFVILNITVKVKCLHGLQFPDGSTEVTSKCLPAPTPYHITGVWVPDPPYKCIEPKKEDSNMTDKSPLLRNHKRFLETLECPNPKTSDNTVTTLDGDPYNMNSEVRVSCNAGLHFENGLDTVNVTCLPLPHPCMCMAAWTRQTDYQLMCNFNCTEQRGTQNILPQAPPIEEGEPQHSKIVVDTKISQENIPVTENAARQATSNIEITEYENNIPVDGNREKDPKTNELEQIPYRGVLNNLYQSENQIYENEGNIYHRTDTVNNEINNVALKVDEENIFEKSDLDEKDGHVDDEEKVINDKAISNSELDIISNDVEIAHDQINEDENNSESELRSSEVEEREDEEEEDEHVIYDEVHQIAQPPLLDVNDHHEEIAEEDEEEEAELSEPVVDEVDNPSEDNGETENNANKLLQEESESGQYNEEVIETEEEWNDQDHEKEILTLDKNGENLGEEETFNEKQETSHDSEEETIHEEEENEEYEQEQEENDDREPQEEIWENSYHSESLEEIGSNSNIVVLDETLPVKGTNIITDEFSDHKYESSEEEFEENAELDHENEDEQEQEIDEIADTETPSETPIEAEVIVETEYDDGEIERPGPLHEIQQTPFHKIDEEEKEMKAIENEEDPCLLPPDSGYGKRIHKRYFFNSSTQECDSFIYGGSGGNENNFQTLDECMDVCYTQKP